MPESTSSRLPGRRETRHRWLHSRGLEVLIEYEVVIPDEDPSEPCLEPDTIQRLVEIARRADAGDIDYLRTIGLIFGEAVS